MQLPAPVTEMRDRLKAAAEGGRIEDLREPIEWNEMPFLFDDADQGGDPIGHWKLLTPEGDGRAVLTDIGRMLALPPARLAIGRDAENSAVYVWPYLSERALDALSADEERDLLTLMDADAAGRLRRGGRWTWWRLVIGGDGNWLALTRRP
jgi:hypothetical protein